MACFAGMARKLIALSTLLFILGGCTGNKQKPSEFQIYSEADSRLNLDFNDRPLSVIFNVYQLKDRQAFARLTFEDFVSGKPETALLGDDIVSKSEFVVLPGSKQSIDTALLPDTKYLGLVSIYRSPAEQKWRYLIPTQQLRERDFWGRSMRKTISVRLHECYISIDGVEIDIIPGQNSRADASCNAPPTIQDQRSTTETDNKNGASSINSKADSTPRSPSEPLKQAASKKRSLSDKATNISDISKAAKSPTKP